MNKVKSPFVKLLRKSGYSVKAAMNITLDAQYNFQQVRSCSLKHFNYLAIHGRFSSLFLWDDTPEGFQFWESIQYALK